MHIHKSCPDSQRGGPDVGKDLKGKELGPNIGQRKNGTYYGRYIDLNGERKMIYDDSLRSLRTRLKDLEFQVTTDRNSPAIINSQLTLDAWYEKWMDIYKDSVRENTKRHYAQVYKKHISPALGSLPLASITNADITKLINELKRKGYQYETKNKVKIMLVDMFSRAILNKLANENPARSVRVFKDKTVERRVLTQEEQTDFFDACKGTFYDELFTVAILTGLRPGEICALRWKDIDLKNCPDLGPVLCTLGMFSEGTTRIYNAARLRIKESDRMEAMRTECAKMGCHIDTAENEMFVHNGHCAPTVALSGWKDHRIVMACAVALSVLGGEIEGCEAVSKSYPSFFEDLKKVGIEVELYD